MPGIAQICGDFNHLAHHAIRVRWPWTTPIPLWNFTANEEFSTSTDSTDVNVGYTYGTPIITKLGVGSGLYKGTWVALVTSGYNNIPEAASTVSGAPAYKGDGKGHLYVLDLATGKELKDISTGVGAADAPSGLAKINAMTSNIVIDNTSSRAYGGDLLGNMWRFNLDNFTATKLYEGDASQPITTAPEIGIVNGKSVVYFGTGKYLGKTDLADATQQAIYAIKDDGTTTIKYADRSSKLVNQSIAGGATSNALDWTKDFGWYINLTDGLGTRVAVNPQLHLGTLLVAATTPPDPSKSRASALGMHR